MTASTAETTGTPEPYVIGRDVDPEMREHLTRAAAKAQRPVVHQQAEDASGELPSSVLGVTYGTDPGAQDEHQDNNALGAGNGFEPGDAPEAPSAGPSAPVPATEAQHWSAPEWKGRISTSSEPLNGQGTGAAPAAPQGPNPDAGRAPSPADSPSPERHTTPDEDLAEAMGLMRQVTDALVSRDDDELLQALIAVGEAYHRGNPEVTEDVLNRMERDLRNMAADTGSLNYGQARRVVARLDAMTAAAASASGQDDEPADFDSRLADDFGDDDAEPEPGAPLPGYTDTETAPEYAEDFSNDHHASKHDHHGVSKPQFITKDGKPKVVLTIRDTRIELTPKEYEALKAAAKKDLDHWRKRDAARERLRSKLPKFLRPLIFVPTNPQDAQPVNPAEPTTPAAASDTQPTPGEAPAAAEPTADATPDETPETIPAEAAAAAEPAAAVETKTVGRHRHGGEAPDVVAVAAAATAEAAPVPKDARRAAAAASLSGALHQYLTARFGDKVGGGIHATGRRTNAVVKGAVSGDTWKGVGRGLAKASGVPKARTALATRRERAALPEQQRAELLSLRQEIEQLRAELLRRTSAAEPTEA
ncbi:MAG TPA: hypothetical protein VLF40_02425 [Candidatus Saccharimonadales bacterium]|nr:hypothetical protein [Candidatus Saccharimonadales bacterium]